MCTRWQHVHALARPMLTCVSGAQVDVEIKYEDLDDLDDGESDSDVDAVRARELAGRAAPSAGAASLTRVSGCRGRRMRCSIWMRLHTVRTLADTGLCTLRAVASLHCTPLACGGANYSHFVVGMALMWTHSGARPVDETADKLDAMMDIVFAHLAR
jgi:hypothetical protein